LRAKTNFNIPSVFLLSKLSIDYVRNTKSDLFEVETVRPGCVVGPKVLGS
jgi:hypothetical protein